jgi:hypothetical protein
MHLTTMKKWMALAALGVAFSVPVGAQKGGGTKVTLVEYPAEITFWSRAEDGVKGDGAVYKNGVNGIKAVFQDKSDGTGTKNFLLNMSRSRGRTLYFDYTDEVATACDADAGSTGILGDRTANFWILNIMSMPLGSTIAKQGTFSTAVGEFRFHDETRVDPIEPYHCGQLMVVTRMSQTHWRVTTDVDSYTVYFNTANLMVTPGSTVQLSGSDGTFRGNYRMQFGADIVCPTCK